MRDIMRTRWAAIGAAVAVTLGAGGVSLTQAALTTGDKPVYVALDAPCRLVDTRPGANNLGPKSTPIGAGETNAYEIQVTGANGDCTGALAVPADAVAVATNVTAIQPVAPSGRSFFTVYPGDAPLPTTSNLNFLNGQAPVPNKVDVGLSATGTIKIFNQDGTAHAAVDVFGYYIDHGHTGADIVDESLTGADILNGSITHVDIADEPGVAFGFNASSTTLNDATIKRPASASIRVPADGFVVAQASGTFTTGGAGLDMAVCQLKKGAVGPLTPGSRPSAWLSDLGVSGAQVDSFSTHAVFEMDVADNPLVFFSGQTIGLDCLRTNGTVVADDVQVTLTYYPRSYAPPSLVIMP